MTLLLLLALLAVIAAGATFALLYPKAERHNALIAVSWGQPDPNGPAALYGAYVWLDGQKPAHAHLTVYIDRPSLIAAYSLPERDLGAVTSPEDAVARFGQVRWDAAGLHLGAALVVPTAELTSHR